MQKIFTEFQYIVNEFEFRIQAQPNAPIAYAKEAGFLFLKDMGVIEDAAKAQEEAKVPVDEPVVEVLAPCEECLEPIVV